MRVKKWKTNLPATFKTILVKRLTLTKKQGQSCPQERKSRLQFDQKIEIFFVLNCATSPKHKSGLIKTNFNIIHNLMKNLRLHIQRANRKRPYFTLYDL